MQQKYIVAFCLAFCGALGTPLEKRGASCGNGKTVGDIGIQGKKIDKNKLKDCLNSIDGSKWLDDAIGQAMDCDGVVSFQSASKSWDSPGDCHNACKGCLAESIDAGVNQIWCDAWAGAAHCWEGYIIPNPPEITDGSPKEGSDQNIKSYGYEGQHGHFIDKYAVQDCLRNLDHSKWLQGDDESNCNDMVTFQSSPSAWDSPSDCYNANKNCVSEAINKGATEVVCTAAAGFAECYLGFHLRDWPEPPPPPPPTTPVGSDPTPTPTPTRIPQEEFDAAEAKYPGIWWKSAADSCSPDNFRILVNATENALWLLDNSAEGDITTSWGWDKYFMPKSIWLTDNKADYDSFSDYYNRIKQHVTVGKTPRKMQSAISYYCGNPGANLNCNKGNVPAYTAFPVDGRTKLENCNSCFAVGFCDLFFSAGYIKDIIGGSPYKEQDLNDKRLVSREHSVIHEWMHNDPVGYDWRVTDVDDTVDGFFGTIYGAGRSESFAWLKKPTVNSQAARNADNYAWVHSYNLYASAWGWKTKRLRREAISAASAVKNLVEDKFTNALKV